MKNCSQATYLFRSISEEEEEDADEAGALGLPLLLPPPPLLLLLLLWHSGVERGSPASQLSADEREPDRSSDDLQDRRSVRRLGNNVRQGLQRGSLHETQVFFWVKKPFPEFC